MKILQLNIEKGRFLPTVLTYVKQNDFDILYFQEVAGGKFSYNNVDCFNKLASSLTNHYGERAIYLTVSADNNSYLANATFIAKDIPLLDKTELWFRERKVVKNIPPTDDLEWAEIPRNALCQLVNMNGKQLWLINTHMPWSPTAIDTANKSLLGDKIYKFIKKEGKPFVLTGDFNTQPGTNLVNQFNALGRNLIEEKQVANTLNPNTHHVNKLFPPGRAVDYIFVDKSLTVKDFRIINYPPLSDHFGLAAEIML